jgi:L-galactose dehydrogenase
MRYKELGRTGCSVSVLGFGASPLGNEFRATDPAEGERAVACAIDNGINYFDVAPYYGRTLAEERLGAALAGHRDKVFLATKCGRYDVASFDFSEARLVRGIDESLKRLRTDHVDLLQMHDVEFVDVRQIFDEAVPALLKIREAGKARFLGVTGLPLKILGEIATGCGLDAVLSYCRYNLLISDMDDLLTPTLREKGIALINASPLNMAILTERGAPAWHPAPPAVKEAGRKIVELCVSRGVRPADVALRFCLDHPYVSTTLVGMSDPRHVETNLRALDFEPEAGLMEEIACIAAPVRQAAWRSGRAENNDYPALRGEI